MKDVYKYADAMIAEFERIRKSGTDKAFIYNGKEAILNYLTIKLMH